MSSPATFENQGVLVVNGTRGIAPDVIIEAARRNGTVVFHAPPEQEATANRLVAWAEGFGLSNRIHPLITDLNDEQSVEELVDSAVERLPGFNVLIHNLEPDGVFKPKPLVDISLAEWNCVLKTELSLPFMLARRAIEEFLFARVNGRIVYIAYSGGAAGYPAATFAAAQSGLRALVRCITKEFGRRQLACNAVVIHEKDQTAVGSSALSPAAHTDVQGAAMASNLVETVLFLGSGESSFVNGEFLDLAAQKRSSTKFTLARRF